MQFLELWRWQGTIERGPYALIGVVGFALKHSLDRLIATWWFDRYRHGRSGDLRHGGGCCITLGAATLGFGV